MYRNNIFVCILLTLGNIYFSYCYYFLPQKFISQFMLKVRSKLILSNEDAKRLLDDKFSSYNNLARPVLDPKDKIELSIGLKLSQIADIVIHL